MLVYFVNHSSAVDHLGGAERSMIALVEDWYEADPEFEAFFITKAPRGKFIEALEQRGWRYKAFHYRGWAVPKKKLSMGETLFFARDDYNATNQIIALMEHRRPALVVTNTLVAPWGAFAAKIVGVPHAWFVREYGDLDHGLKFQIGRAGTLEDIGLLSEAVFANSRDLKKHIGQHMDESLVTIVYPTLDTERIHRLATEKADLEPFPQSEGHLNVTVVGRVTGTKGQWRLVEAIGVLATRGLRVNVCFVGANAEADHDLQLMKRARELGVASQIVFANEQENPFPFIAAADVCVTPSAYEAFGRTTLEYMALGKAVIATSTGGSPELVVPEHNGFLFDPADMKALSDHLQTYAEDQKLARRHGEAGLARAAEFQTHEYGNQAAIQRLKQTAHLQPYRLPNVARMWFRLPGLYSTRQSGPRITARYVVARFASMTRNFVKNPVAAVRRRIRG